VDSFLRTYQNSLENICKTYKVKSLFAFGSLVRNEMKPDSDIDLLVEISEQDPFLYTDCYFELKKQFENLFGRTIDLMEMKSLKNPYLKKEIDNTKVLLYGKGN
jgi:predicted nucleotidyltransferase